jgi:excisionase family DNA binding protein
MSKAYTVSSLAEHWDCSEGVIRKAIADGRLGCFRLGTLIRISPEEVARFECQTTQSSASGELGPSSITTRTGSVCAADYMPPIGREPRQRRADAGVRAATARGR